MANNFKNYGLKTINDDSFLTLAGSIGSAANGISRVLWGVSYDKFNFKKTFGGLIVIQIVLAATLELVNDIKPVYFIYVCLILVCNGGLFVIFPPLCSKVLFLKFRLIVDEVLWCFTLSIFFLLNIFFVKIFKIKLHRFLD